jgi:hypothetical protein
MSIVQLVLTLVGFVLLLVLVLGALGFLPFWVTAIVLGLGLSVLIYFVIAKATFGKK